MKNESNQTLHFETVVHTYSQDLYRYGLWLTRKPADAEDLVQETFLRAWKSMDTLKDPSAIKSWLITILRRENARRFEKKRPELTSMDNDYLNDIPQPEEESDELEVLRIRTAISKLENNYAEPLVLQALFGYRCKEISQLLEIKEGAVLTRLFRARKKLQLLLNEKGVVNQEEKLNEQFNLAMAV